MKPQYFGDVNDYLKYGFLRGVVAGTGLILGVCWLLTPDDGGKDGELRRYLTEPGRWRRFDPPLFDALAQLLADDLPRTVQHASEWSLVPGARFYGALLIDDAEAREKYFQGAEAALSGCDLWFFDPDNGVEVKSVPFGRRRSAKFLYWREIERAYRAGRSLVIYQHFPREPRGEYTRRIRAELQARTGAPDVLTIYTSRVLYLVVCQAIHAPALKRAIGEVVARWHPRMSADGPS